MGKIYSAAYLDGIKEGRAMLQKYGADIAQQELENLDSTIRKFAASNPVGQMLRGERDFWRNQVKKAALP